MPIDEANETIRKRILDGGAFMAARFGSIEFEAVRTFVLSRRSLVRRLHAYAYHNEVPWWRESTLVRLANNTGFFPATKEMVDRFCETMLEAMGAVDLLGSWVPGENLVADLMPAASVCELRGLEPYYSTRPWTEALAHRRVCVVHPFAETIVAQMKKRQALFADPRMLPDFDLVTVKAVQSIAGNRTDFADWFAALDWMYERAMGQGFDVAIVGCGAYGFPLAARLKSAGKQVVHLGGATQLLFGIKGRRWDSHPVIGALYNEHWVRPSEEERPKGAEGVEGACYW